MAAAEAFGVPGDAYEIQMLHGMGEPIQRALVDRGIARPGLHALRGDAAGDGVPGAPAPGEHVERVVPEGQLHRAARVDDLLRNPEEVGAMWSRKPRPKPETAAPVGLAAVPERAADRLHAVRGAARRCRAALEEVRGQLGRSYPLVIGGREVATVAELAVARPGRLRDGHRPVRPGAEPSTPSRRSRRPSRGVRGVVGHAGRRARRGPRPRRRDHAAAARSSWPPGRSHECGKPWREADADVAEAIDFCEFYAREMIRLAEPRRRDVPGETNARSTSPGASRSSSLPGTSRWRSRPA